MATGILPARLAQFGDNKKVPSDSDSTLLRRWVETWREVGPELEAIRRREIAAADNVAVLASLEEAFNHALRTLPPRTSSGMVEMQRIFSKMRAGQTFP